MKIDKSKYIARFAAEAEEHLARMNEGILALEKDAGDAGMLNQVFRSAHTIKGSSRMLGFSAMGELAHKFEDALEVLKRGKAGGNFFHVAFKALDLLSSMVAQAKAGVAITEDVSEVLHELLDLAKGEAPVAAARAVVEDLPAPQPESTGVPELSLKKARFETVRVDTGKLDEVTKLVVQMVSNQSRLKQNLLSLEVLRKDAAKMLEMIAGAGLDKYTLDQALEHAGKIAAKLRQVASYNKNDLLYQGILTQDLLEKIGGMRTLPISTVLDSFHRYVRDISISCGKKAELIVEGGETGLDKTIIEKLGEPLLHMVRNSIDHGIEQPAERLRLGKPDTGVIRVSAGYDGGSVYLVIADDGAGIPVEKIREKALHKGMYAKETLDAMSREDLLSLIFMPGFSTSSFITDISGRGVGMDVVKECIVAGLKGAIHLQSVEGGGTTFFVRLPLRVAVMRVFLVTSATSLIGLLVDSIVEVLTVQRDEIIDVVDKKAIRLREKLVPVVDLARVLSLQNEAGPGGYATVVVMRYGEELLGVVVDVLIGEEDMEIKPLPPHMKNSGIVSGVAMTGKNDLVIVLNVAKVFALAKDVGVAANAPAAQTVHKSIHILVIDDSVNTREIERNILESYGYRVDVAVDGLDGYEKAQGGHYDLIVTDIEMPRMDGFTLTEKLRQDADYKHTPIIIVSSRDMEEDKRRGMRVGASAYIVKGSFDQSNLLATIQALV
ncbi:MAG: hybrid sensor histidine kinase/response regulator [Methylococcaceae bacterium]|nr:MAG: hybrid sensor histidine kinase/response regulator [Methylococcaceae bacterium]